MSASIRVVFFATAREAVGVPSLEWDIPARGCSIATVLAAVAARHPRLKPVLSRARLVRNGSYVSSARTRVVPGDELAVHPPYSGG